MSVAAKKTVVLTQPDILITTPQATWQDVQWPESIQEHGYLAYIEHALECPCGTKGQTTASPDCISCGSTGRFWIDKTQTRMLCQGMNFQNKYQNFSAENMGTVRITVNPADKLGYMDKVTLLELEAVYSQKIYLRMSNDGTTLFGFTTYDILTVYDCYLFQGNNLALKPLLIGTDFTVIDNKIIMNSSYNSVPNARITVRYLHNPMYFVLEANRDLIRTKILPSCQKPTDTPMDNQPLSFIAKKAQYLPELLNYDGTGTIDNTNYNRTPINYNYTNNIP